DLRGEEVRAGDGHAEAEEKLPDAAGGAARAADALCRHATDSRLAGAALAIAVAAVERSQGGNMNRFNKLAAQSVAALAVAALCVPSAFADNRHSHETRGGRDSGRSSHQNVDRGRSERQNFDRGGDRGRSERQNFD